jgi:steroid 5-alpha reductase family enzyme
MIPLEGPWTILQTSAITAILYQLPYYVFSYLKQTDHLADIAGTSGFIFIIWFVSIPAHITSIRLLLVNLGITLWALRLGGK